MTVAFNEKFKNKTMAWTGQRLRVTVAGGFGAPSRCFFLKGAATNGKHGDSPQNTLSSG